MSTTLPPNYDTRAPGIVACAVVMIVIPTLAVALRFWSRAVEASLVFWWDDWAVLVTLIFSHIFLITNIYWTTIGLGKHTWMIPDHDIIPNNITNRVALVFYATVILMIKLSALLLYKRLFKIDRRFGRLLWAVGVIVTAWWIIVAIVPWFSCTPIQKDINPLLPGVCKAYTAWYLTSAFINAFWDFVVLVLPMPMIWRLQMSFQRKIVISLVLLLGYCSAFLSFARFIMIVIDPSRLSASPNADFSWDLVPLLYLSMLEGPFAILALCGPSINQLVARAVKYRSINSLFTSHPRNDADTIETGDLSGRHNRAPSSGFSKIGSSNGTGTIPDWEVGRSSSTAAIADPYNQGGDDWREPNIQMDSIELDHDHTARSEE